MKDGLLLIRRELDLVLSKFTLMDQKELLMCKCLENVMKYAR